MLAQLSAPDKALLARHRDALRAYGEGRQERLPLEVEAMCWRTGLLERGATLPPRGFWRQELEADGGVAPAARRALLALSAAEKALLQQHAEAIAAYGAEDDAELPPEVAALAAKLGLLEDDSAPSPSCHLAPLHDATAGLPALLVAHGRVSASELLSGVRQTPPSSPLPPSALEALRAAGLERETVGEWTRAPPRPPPGFFSPVREWLRLMAGLERTTSSRSAPWLSLTFALTWCGDDLETTQAVACLCAATGLDMARRALRDELRPARPELHTHLLDGLRQLRRSPDEPVVWAEVSENLRELCYGRLASARLRAGLVRHVWAAAAGCAEPGCRARRARGGPLCPACGPERPEPAAAAELATLDFARGLAAALWELEERCLHGALVHSAPPRRCAPLLRLHLQLAEAAGEARGLGGRRAARRRQALEARAERAHPNWRGNAAARASLAADEGLCARLLGPAPVLRAPATQRALDGDEPRDALRRELEALEDAGLGGALAAELLLGTAPRGEGQETLQRWLQHPAARRALQLREALGAAAPPAAGDACSLRRALCPALLAAEGALERAAAPGAWGFRSCLARLVPRLEHLPARGADDDARPRPPPLLAPAEGAAALAALDRGRHARGEPTWTVSLLPHGRADALRLRRALAAAAAADASKVAKSWAPPFLHPSLEGAAAVPMRGPHAWDDAPLGRSRYFCWPAVHPEGRILREELAQMLSVLEAMEPQEHWVQTTGVLKRDAVRLTRALHQENGHLLGDVVVSPLCRACAPRAALWCRCAAPERARCRALLRERWHLPAFYRAHAAWRERGAAAPRAAVLVLDGPARLPPPPRGRVEARDWGAAELRVTAEGGKWLVCQARGNVPARRLGLCDRDDGPLDLPLGARAVLAAGLQPPPRARLDDAFRRRDDGRLLLQAGAFFRQAAPGRFVDDLGRAAEGRMREAAPGSFIRVGSLLHDAAPAEARSWLPPRQRLRLSPASAFEARLLFPEHRALKRARRAGEEDQLPELPDDTPRVSLRLAGLCLRAERCAACARPACACGAPVPWRCASCGAARHLAFTATDGTEDWICGTCAAAPALAQPPPAAPAVAPRTLQLQRCQPALAAAWAARLPAPANHWARAAHDGTTIDASHAPRLPAHRAPALHGATLRRAAPHHLRRLPVQAVADDRHAAAALGAPAALGGTLLQRLMAPATHASPQSTPLQAAQTIAGAVAAL